MPALSYSPEDYSALISSFLSSGKVVPTLSASDPMAAYIYSVLSDPSVSVLALPTEVGRRVLLDTLMRFVSQLSQSQAFRASRARSFSDRVEAARNFSPSSRRGGWRALVDLTRERALSSFPADYYTRLFSDDLWQDDDLWRQFISDLQQASSSALLSQVRHDVESQARSNTKVLKDCLAQIPAYLRSNNVSPGHFFQVWNVMGGLWNDVIFSRASGVVALQGRYPVLEHIARLMGRQVSPQGEESVRVGSSGPQGLPRASKSDISGVELGGSLEHVMPHELALFASPALSGLFFARLLSHRLMSFGSMSACSGPARSLNSCRARRLGPMIVCIDTSGSMRGEPFRLAQSLVLRLISIALEQNRALQLVTFANGASSFNAVSCRSRVLDFFSSLPSGGTLADPMLQCVFSLLSSPSGLSAGDVLLISDFLLPLASSGSLSLMAQFSSQGTCFYGLQVGRCNHSWSPFFKQIFQLDFFVNFGG